MAIQPPPAPPPAPPAAPLVPQQANPPPGAQRRGCFGRGCGCGCGGCLLVFVLALLLAAGGGWWFFVVQASAAVTAPATLVVFNQVVTVNGHPGIPGQALNANDDVQTSTGHAAIQFPDGSYVRMSPSSDVRITKVELQRNGNLQTAEVLQKAGRTFVNVQHLVAGATFKVDGHSVSAQVRGTQFEVFVEPNGKIQIKVFAGSVTVTAGGRTVTVNAGQEVEVAADGTITGPRAITTDRQDPYPLSTRCANAVSSGTTNGTQQVSTGDPITTGAAPEVDYDSPGGTLLVALCYPGSKMTLSVFTPDGVEHAAANVPTRVDGPAGHYRAIVRAVDVSPAEAYVVAFATNAPCESSSGATGGATVRETLSNAQISDALAKAGSQGVTLQVQGTSPTSAHLVYYSNTGGVELSWTIDFYAATPYLGAVITQVTVRGINMTTTVIKNLSSFGGNSITSIPSDFIVDRVYSCAAANGDNMMVVEGHR